MARRLLRREKDVARASEPSYCPAMPRTRISTVVDLHDVFGGLAEKRDVRHPAAKSIEPRLAAPGHRPSATTCSGRISAAPGEGPAAPSRRLAEHGPESTWRSARCGPARRVPKARRAKDCCVRQMWRRSIVRLLVDLMRRADLGDPAIVHDRDAIRQRQCLRLVVRHVDGRDPNLLLQAAELAPHLLAELGVEIAQRLVQQQQPRLRDQALAPAPAAAAGRRSIAPPNDPRRRQAPWFRVCASPAAECRARSIACPGSIRSGNAVLSNTVICGQTA